MGIIDKKATTRELPVLDLADYLSGVDGAADSLALQMRDVCENIGFFFIRNHGVSEDLINAFLPNRSGFTICRPSKK